MSTNQVSGGQTALLLGEPSGSLPGHRSLDVGCFLTFDEAELSDVVAVVRRVDDVRVLQLPRLH